MKTNILKAGQKLQAKRQARINLASHVTAGYQEVNLITHRFIQSNKQSLTAVLLCIPY